MELRQRLTLPSGFRRGRVPVRLARVNADVVELLAASHLGEATHQVVDALGVPLLTHLSERDHVIAAGLATRGIWEPAETLMLQSLAGRGMVALDLGANVGYFSSVLARALGPTGRVISFEPEPDNALLLAANAELIAQVCPQAAPIFALPAALGERPGTARLNVFRGNLGLHSLVHGAGRPVVEVPIDTLDRLAFADDPPRPPWDRPIDLVKIDTQGSELAILRGGGRLIVRDRPVICLECEPVPNGVENSVAVVDWLADHGYADFRLFHADRADAPGIASEWQSWYDADEVRRRIRDGLVGAYGTLLARPDRSRGA